MCTTSGCEDVVLVLVYVCDSTVDFPGSVGMSSTLVFFSEVLRRAFAPEQSATQNVTTSLEHIFKLLCDQKKIQSLVMKLLKPVGYGRKNVRRQGVR